MLRACRRHRFYLDVIVPVQLIALWVLAGFLTAYGQRALALAVCVIGALMAVIKAYDAVAEFLQARRADTNPDDEDEMWRQFGVPASHLKTVIDRPASGTRQGDAVSGRYFGPKHASPCKNPYTITCAWRKCQEANECQYETPAQRKARWDHYNGGGVNA